MFPSQLRSISDLVNIRKSRTTTGMPIHITNVFTAPSNPRYKKELKTDRSTEASTAGSAPNFLKNTSYAAHRIVLTTTKTYPSTVSVPLFSEAE